jgi:hypothetical protein
VRDLEEHARPVARLVVPTDCAPVHQVFEYRDPLAHDAVRGFTLDVRYETDAARVVLEGRVVETSLGHIFSYSPYATHAHPIPVLSDRYMTVYYFVAL